MSMSAQLLQAHLVLAGNGQHVGQVDCYCLLCTGWEWAGIKL